MHKYGKSFLKPAAAACLLAVGGVGLQAHAQQVSNADFLTTVSIEVYPVAYLEFDGNPLLSLDVPPPGSTIPSNGVAFTVYGNALATLSAEPDAFIQVDGPEGWLGKAVMGSEAIGYDIELRFPRYSPNIQFAFLPGDAPNATDPLSVDLTLTNGEREGVIHLVASQAWTEDGGLPLPGLYEGSIVLNLTAGNF